MGREGKGRDGKGREGKGSRNPAIHAGEKSDAPMVSKKLPNKNRPAEEVRRKGGSQGECC
jgi:hypothetical protein